MKVAMSGTESDSDHESLGAWVKKEGIINGWIGFVPHRHID